MAKVSLLEDSDRELSYSFYCAGCRCGHMFFVRRHDGKPDLWTWNNDFEKPSIYPSIDCNRSDPKTRCHSIIREGMIQYLSDCYHALRGKTVPMEADD
jgi:hypothetical protein